MMRTPAFWYRPFGWQALLFWPLSLLYGLGRFLHVRIIRPKAAQCPAICVGNLVAGGAGKTPTVLALASLLNRHGLQPRIITRGYKGTQRSSRQVASADTAASVGDEALLLAQSAPTWVVQNRQQGILAIQAAGASVVLLDDGLQSPNLRATLNLLVVDGESGFGNGMLMPAGPLREPFNAALARTDAVIMIGNDIQQIASRINGKPVFHAEAHYDLTLIDQACDYVAFAGLARPEKFFAAARAQGLRLASIHAFADHHAYTASDRNSLKAQAAKSNARLLTTAKDAVRWPADKRHQLSILPLDLQFTDPQGLLRWLQKMGIQ